MSKINFESLRKQLESLDAKKPRLAVAGEADNETLLAVEEAVENGWLSAVYYGSPDEAVARVKNGDADFVMKGMVDTSVLLKAVLNKEYGLRTGNLLSHLMAYELKSYHKPLFLTDGGMNIAPSLDDKIGIIKNTTAALKAIGYKTIKIAALAAKEKPDPKMPATCDGAALKEMADNGDFGDGVVIAGPVSLDIAISKEAAEIKGFENNIAGDADVLLVPNIETGNCLGKSMTYFGGASHGGMILGAAAPVLLTSRSDPHDAKLNSIVLGSIVGAFMPAP